MRARDGVRILSPARPPDHFTVAEITETVRSVLMADDKHKRRQDAKLVAAEQSYELEYFARKHGLSLEIARLIIGRYGPSRRECDKQAEHYKAGIAEVSEASEASEQATDKGSQ